MSFIEQNWQGNTLSLEDFKGSVIALSFSAMWCGPCRQEAQELINIYNTYKERGLVVLQCLYEDEDYNYRVIRRYYPRRADMLRRPVLCDAAV